jgi:hypothetical protein
MQTATMRLSFFCCAIFMLSFSGLCAQCDASKLITEYVSQLEDYNFLKGYKFVDPKPTNEYSYVFTKGSAYKITLCLESERKKSNVEILIFDRSRNLVASNINNRKKDKNILEFKCTTTGIYYMKYNFKDEIDFCGASVLAFKRN